MANKKKKKNIFEEAIDETLSKKQTTTNKNSNRSFIDSGASDIAPSKSKQSGLISSDTKNAVLNFLGNQFKVNDFKNIWSNGYDFGDFKKTIDTAKSIISPQEQIKQKASSTLTDLAKSDGKLFKESKAIKDTKDALKNTWSDGYQFGDIYKSKNAIQSGITKTILGTTADVGTNLVKGELQTAEGLVDTGRYLTSDLVRATGYNETADKIKERAIQNTTGFILGENDLYNNPKQDGWSKKVDEYSVFDQKLDQIGQSVGQQAFRIGLQKALMGKAPDGGATAKGVQAFNQLEIFAGSYGQAKSEAYMQGADDKTATTRGIISGTAEFISENLFDNVPGFKTSEMKSLTRLKDFISSSTEKAMGKKAGQLITKFFGGFGEGVEEILSNTLETTFTNVANYINPDYVYGMEEGQGIRDADNKVWKMFQDIYGSATSQESKDAFITSFFSTLITAGLTSGMNNKQRSQVINAYAQENNISTKQATELFDAIRDARLEQVVDEKTGYTERTELEEQATQQLVNEMQNNPKLNLEELFLATPKNRQESQFVFTNDERKNIKSEKQKVLANDLQRLNNTKEVHDTYEIANRMQGLNDTHQYHVTTTEGLVELGIVTKDENGNYGMINDKGEFIPYVPRGMNYGKNGDIYLNADVGTKSGTQAMYHEIFEGFKKANDTSYKELKQMVRDIVGEQTIQDEIPLYKQMYGEDYADIEDEIINDKFGEIAENQKFINKIADNRSVLEKFVDSIKNMIKYIKGTPQEKQLIKLQNKLEKEFAKRYKKTDFSKNEGETALSLQSNKDSEGRTLTKEQQNYFKDSKVVDRDGNLMVMYHGSSNGNYTIFDKNKIGGNTRNKGLFGTGFYFTENKELADSYDHSLDRSGKTFETYLNITNPFYWNSIKTEEQLNELNKELNLKNPLKWNRIMEEIHSISPLGKNDTNYGDSIELSNALQNAGYDGIIYKYDNTTGEYVVFEPNQIKNIDNTNPTNSPDIRYSLTPIIEKNEDINNLELSKSKYQSLRPNVRNGWTMEKINKQLKQESSSRVNSKDISEFDNIEDVMNNLYYHGSISAHDNLKVGAVLPESVRTGGYGQEYHTISLSGNKNIASNFSSMGQYGVVMPVILKKNANVIEMPNIEDSIEIEDILPELWNKGVDAVKIGDWDIETKGYGEQELVVLNPRAIMTLPEGNTYYKNYHKPKFDNMTKQELRDALQKRYDRALQDEKLTEANRQRVIERYEKIIPKNEENYSLTSNQNINSKEIAPVNSTLIQEQLSNLSEQMNNLSNQLENMQRGYVETTGDTRYDQQTYNPMTEEEANLYQDAITNDEAYMKSLSEQDIDTNANLIKTLTNNVQSKLDVNKYNRPRLEEVIRDAVENKLSATEIADRLSPFSTYENQTEVDGLKQVKKTIREMPIKVPDVVKRSIADYGKWKQSNFGKITFSNDGQGIDQTYQQLCNMYPEFFSEDIINDTDQLLRIAEVVNMKNIQTTSEQFDWDYVENVADYIEDYILNDQYKTQTESQASLDKDIQFDFTEDIAPTTIRSQESVDDYIENRDIAPVNPKVAEKQKSPYRQRVDRMWNTLQEMFVNRNHLIDEFSKATGNNEIKFAGDNLNNVSGETGFNVNSHQTDINGHWVGKSVHDIFAPAKKAGLYNAFNDYLIQKSNIERHAVGKGSQVPLAVSQQLVNQYETENPIFKTWAKDVYKYFDNILQEQVDAGLITQEKYNDYRGEDGIYRSYVPFYEGELDIKRFFDDDGNLRPYSTLKKSKGNATDVNKMLSVEESMARQTYAQKRAIRQNMLFGQIVNSLDKYTDAMDMDIRNDPTNLDDNLYTTENGDKVLSAYVNGEKVSAIISDELYNELSQANENRVKQLEQDFSLITNPLQKMSNVRRNLITTWNPVFLARNAIKDIQDAVINSKHTGSMLKNYYGLNKSHTPAIMELAQAKTQEAQQFLALYGSDATLGDYSKTNKFTRLNELIELAPRYAEFKASLENGESINEALYNAREVTTNFGRGGYITKAMNRNGFTFLNANVQGLDKLVRNLSGQNGVKGVASVVTKGALFSILPAILNHMMYGGSGDDKDEDYEALPDYVKDNYYLIKLEDGNFLRIPKGRINAVFGSLARRMIETGQTGENQLKGWGENAWSQIGVGDANGLQTMFTPIKEAINNKAWHGGDIVPTRLQSKPAGEQSDEKTDYISKTLGELFNVSPKKINYVLDQYSGGLGDLLLPMITPASQNGAEGLEYLTSPVKDAFVVNSTDDNKYAGEFYDLKEELEVKKNGSNATDEDVLKYNYLSSVSSKMSDLYKEKREVQSDTDLSNSEKYKKVQNIQNEINNLAKNALNDYKNISGTDTFKQVGDTQYYKNNKGGWSKVSDSDDEFTAGMTQTEKSSYFNTKNKISDIKSNDKLSYANKKEKITNAIVNSGLDDYSKAMLYAKNYSSETKMNNVYNAGYDIDTYITAISDIDQLRDKYQVKKGYSVDFRKNKTIAYVNSLNIEIPQKAMLIREYYSSFRSYNNDIVNYVANLDLTYDEKKKILEGTGMTVKGNNVNWK